MLYQQVAAFIKRLIDEEGLQPGEQLPTEEDLCGLTGVSRITVRRALDELTREGVVERRRGVGTFVARNRHDAWVALPGSLAASLGSDGRALTSELISFDKVGMTTKETGLLGESPGAAAWRVVRLRRVNGEPVILDRSLIPVRLSPNLTEADVAGADSLYGLLAERYGLEPGQVDQDLRVVAARTEELRLLDLAAGAPVVLLSGVTQGAMGVPFDAFRMVFRADRFAFRLGGNPAELRYVPRPPVANPV